MNSTMTANLFRLNINNSRPGTKVNKVPDWVCSFARIREKHGGRYGLKVLKMPAHLSISLFRQYSFK